jgi:hypothetical protein
MFINQSAKKKIAGVSSTLLLFAAVVMPCNAVEMHNWRAPYYQIAAEMGLVSSSPSGMFWDDLVAAPLMDSTVWYDENSMRGNHWVLEPALALGMQSPAEGNEKIAYGAMEVLNDIRYRNLLIRQTLHADKRYDYDQYFPAHPDRFARGRIEEAYAQFDGQYGFVRMGRMLRNWGPFVDRSLFLSSNPYSYDAVEWGVHSSIFEFRQLFAAFAKSEGHPVIANNPDDKAGRYFAAHSLNVMFKKWATFGVFETMLFRRDQGFPDLQYVNPFSVYTVTNTNQEGSGNLMLGFQTSIHPGTDKIDLLGQLLLDDFQVDNKATTDKEPAHWGVDAGIYCRDVLPLPLRNLLKAGYQRRSEWMYTVTDDGMDRGEGYTYLSKSLGLPRNDGDNVWLGASVIGKNYWLGTAMLSYGRDGDKTVLSRWDDTAPGNTGGLPFDYKLSAFPSGIVESTLSFSLEGAAYYKDFVDFSMGLTNRWIKNKGNVATSGSGYSPLFTCAIGLHFSDLRIALPM